MKLTKAQRHKIYKEAKQIHIDSGGSWPLFYLCCAIREALIDLGFLSSYGEYFSDGDIHALFPEFTQKKPDILPEGSTAWWGSRDFDSRIKCMNACIRETAPKKRKKVSNQTKSKK